MSKDTKYHSLWKDYLRPADTPLKEEKGRSRQRGIYKFLFMIGYNITSGPNAQRGLDDIASDIRALKNVTIVTIVIGNKNIGEKQYVAGVALKFIASNPGEFSSPEETKARILRDLRRIKNVQRLYKVSPGLDRIE